MRTQCVGNAIKERKGNKIKGNKIKGNVGDQKNLIAPNKQSYSSKMIDKYSGEWL